MIQKDATQKLKEALSKSPKIRVKNGKVEVETPDDQAEEVEEASEIRKHKFA